LIEGQVDTLQLKKFTDVVLLSVLFFCQYCFAISIFSVIAVSLSLLFFYQHGIAIAKESVLLFNRMRIGFFNVVYAGKCRH